MTFSNTGLGQYLLGATDLADDKQFQNTAAAGALAITYTVILPGGAGLAITYTVQDVGGSGLTIAYYVVPATTAFSINGTLIPKPQHIAYNLPQSIGHAIGGIDVQQGLTALQFTYDQLLDSDMQVLESLYDPTAPQVLLVYPNELGFWVQKTAQMQPPVLGTRATVVHNNVSLTFTGITPD